MGVSAALQQVMNAFINGYIKDYLKASKPSKNASIWIACCLTSDLIWEVASCVWLVAGISHFTSVLFQLTAASVLLLYTQYWQ